MSFFKNKLKKNSTIKTAVISFQQNRETVMHPVLKEIER
jgi:hypothetical protein